MLRESCSLDVELLAFRKGAWITTSLWLQYVGIFARKAMKLQVTIFQKCAKTHLQQSLISKFSRGRNHRTPDKKGRGGARKGGKLTYPNMKL